MKRLLIPLVSLVLACGCLGTDDDDDGTPAPTGSATPTVTATPGAGDFSLTVNGVQFGARNGEEALVRVLVAATQVACGQVTVADDGFTLVMPMALTNGSDHDIEVVVNTDGNAVFDDGTDEIWTRQLQAAAADDQVNINGNSNPAVAVTWADGTGC